MFTKRSLFLKRHARRVLIIKHALPVVAFLFAATLIVWPLLTPDKERFDLPVQKSQIKTPSIDMDHIRFFAQDDKQRTMAVTAESVKEIDMDKKIVRLQKPLGVYTLSDGDVLTSETSYGLAYQQNEYFLFDQPILTKSESGYTAHASDVKATYDGVLESRAPIKVDGPAGNLNAEGFLLKNKGNLIDFYGPTRSQIEQKESTIFVNSSGNLHIDRLQKTITAHKNVRIRQQENILTADKVILYYTDDKENRVKKIVADGQVILQNSKNKISGNKGEYSPLTQEMTMMGDVRIYQGKSFVKGQKATLNMKTGESRLFNEGGNNRVKGAFSPEDLKDRK